MDILSDKPAKSHTRRLGHNSEKKTLRETESLFIAAQNNAISTYYVKAGIDKIEKISDGDYVVTETKRLITK